MSVYKHALKLQEQRPESVPHTEEEKQAIAVARGKYWLKVQELREKGKLPKTMTVEIPDDCGDPELLDLKQKLKEYLDAVNARRRIKSQETSSESDDKSKVEDDEKDPELSENADDDLKQKEQIKDLDLEDEKLKKELDLDQEEKLILKDGEEQRITDGLDA